MTLGRRYIRAGRVYKAVGRREVLVDAAVILDDNRIADVVAAGQITSHDRQIAHYPTATLLPGLIDAHCHMSLAGDGRSYQDLARDPDEMMALVSVRNLRQHLNSGITTIRDNGARNRVTFIVREAQKRGYFKAPRMLLSGRPVTHTRGHFHWCDGVADGPEEIRKTVRQLVAEGADHIKIMASGGGTMGTMPYLPAYTADELRVAVEAAHDLDRPTTAHCRAKQSVANAVAANLDCIEHYEFLVHDPTAPYAAATSGGRIEFDPRIVQDTLESGSFVSFTMSAAYGTLLRLNAQRDAHKLSIREGQQRDAFEMYFDAKLQLFSALLDHGLLPKLVISSDAGCGDDDFGKLYLGLELAVEGGMSEYDAIASVTAVAAEACGISDTVGTLEIGKQADFVVVDGDPFQEIRQMRAVRAVYQAGQLVGPSEG